jgi:hypothetical protein
MRRPVAAAVALVLMCAAVGTRAQIRYERGQDVGPTYEGWQRNADGSYSLYFGYYNRNAAEALDVAIGPDNSFDLGDGDQGQPTHFYPGRRWWVFRVQVPATWPKDKRVVWTLVTRGVTNQAKGWLQPEWEIDKGVVTKNSSRDPFLMFAGGNGEADFENQPPVLSGTASQTVGVSQPLTLTVSASDDARPKPAPGISVRRPQGLRIRWIVYRGEGPVVFAPEIMPERVPGSSSTFTSTARFALAGTYRLRAIASDGQLTSTHDVDVVVQGPRSTATAQ